MLHKHFSLLMPATLRVCDWLEKPFGSIGWMATEFDESIFRESLVTKVFLRCGTVRIQCQVAIMLNESKRMCAPSSSRILAHSRRYCYPIIKATSESSWHCRAGSDGTQILELKNGDVPQMKSSACNLAQFHLFKCDRMATAALLRARPRAQPMRSSDIVSRNKKRAWNAYKRQHGCQSCKQHSPRRQR